MAKTSLNLDEKIEGLLCYLGIWITGLIFYLLESDNKFVRFHAMQSIIVFLPVSILITIFWWIPIIGWILSPLISIIMFVLWVILMIKAYQGEKFKLPIAGDIAEKNS